MLTKNEALAKLVKLADKFDNTEREDIANDIDGVLSSFASRVRAPLKNLDDELKKGLLIFVTDADANTSRSMKGLEELLRRMRYFDLADSVRELGIDKIIKQMNGTQGSLGEVKRRLFELMHGKKPSASDLEGLAKEKVEEQNASDFFNKYMEKDLPEKVEEEEEIDKKIEENEPEEDVSDMDIESFWKTDIED